MCAVLLDQVQGRFGLGVERIQRDKAAFQVEFGEELARDGNLVGFLVHHRAAQIILAGH